MQAITTRYIGPTNFRGSRVKAQCDAGSLVWHWDYRLGPDENHDKACAALVARLKWPGPWFGGTLAPSEKSARCYVCVPALRRLLDGEWSADTREELARIVGE